MGLRFRKSFKIAPGVRLNLGKKSAGLSFGTKGVRYSVSTSGRRTSTVGIPGTGLSYSTSSGGRKKSSGSGSVGPVAHFLGRACFWVFIGWWWWPIRLVCYDLPKFIIKRIKAAIDAEKPEV